MNPEEFIQMGEAFTPVQPEVREWHIDAEPSNIISLAERGLLVADPAERIPDAFTYENYSPLNEW